MLEIFMIYTALSLILIPLFRFQGAVHGYSEAKEYVFICLSALAFVGMLFTGIPVISSPIDVIFLLFVAFITFSVYWSAQPTVAIRDVPRWWAIFLLFIVCHHVPVEFLMLALFLPAPVVTAYGMYQQIMKRDPIDHWVNDILVNRTKKLRFYSFLGNSNYTGSYLVASIFAGVYCTANISLWFTPVLALVIVGIALTRARGAWVGVVAGFLAVMPDMWPYMVPLWAAMVVLSWRRWETAKQRGHYLNVGWTIFKEKFLFGWGPMAFRMKLFRTQAYMNQQDPSLLGTVKKPGRIETALGKRMHNDHAEMFVEYGLAGVCMWCAILGLGIWQAVNSGQWYIAGGIVAMAVNGLFFYPVRVLGIGIGLWVFLGAGSSNLAHSAFLTPPLYLSIPLTVLVLFLTWEFAVKKLMAIAHFYQYHMARRMNNVEKGKREIAAALELDPNNGGILSESAEFYANAAPPMALQTAMRCIDLFDGEKIEWSLWVQLGGLGVMNGAAEFARVCFRMAIYLNPSYKKPYECINQLDELLKNMGGKGSKAPAGFKEKGGVLVPDKKIVRVQ